MCNENKNKEDVRFLSYKLDQLEKNLREGQEKLETAQSTNYNQLISILQQLQEGNNIQNQKLVELTEKQKVVESKVVCIDRLKEVATKHNTEIHELERRLEIYKQVLFVVGTGVAVALVTEVLRIL